MWDTIDRLRAKPKAVRNHVAFLVAVAVAVLVTGVWSLSIPARIADVFPSDTATTANVAGPTIFESVRSFPRSIRQLFTGAAAPVQTGAVIDTTTPRNPSAETGAGASTTPAAWQSSGVSGRSQVGSPILIETRSAPVSTSSLASTTASTSTIP